MHTIYYLQRQQPIWFHCAKILTSLCTTETTIFLIDNKNVLNKRQPIQPVFCNNNRFMYFPQQWDLQRFLFILRAHGYVYLIINTNSNRIRRTQLILSLTGCIIFNTFDPFSTFHLSLLEFVSWRFPHQKKYHQIIL